MAKEQSGLKKLLVSRVTLFILISLIVLFLPAGTLAYWQAWMYLLFILIPAGFVLFYFYKNSPEFLERRMNFKERRQTQKRIVRIGDFIILLAFILPGFDQRWGWSHVPVGVAIAAEAGVLLGYLLIVRVFLENRYTSRVVEVADEQKVISSGPYAVVRHPMYSGTVLFYLLSPLALGSYWAMIPAALIIPVLVLRIKDEELLLHRELPGYSQYTQKVRYRLIPRIW
ncbi:MAG: isoprenylcysteine carboxylmethyltransferase family protein [Anaerolineaceae bacterium]